MLKVGRGRLVTSGTSKEASRRCWLLTACVPVSYVLKPAGVYAGGKSNAVSCCYIGMEVWSRVSRKLLTYEEL